MNNRSQGWQYAKLSGHLNEKIVCDEINSNIELQNRLINVAGCRGNFKDVSIGGLHETEVISVFGDKTKAKPDVIVGLDNGETIRVSIKKSLSGQVYLVTIDRFIDCFEKQTGKAIPANVKRAISLFWGGAPDTIDIIKSVNSKHRSYEIRKCRLVKETLDVYDKHLSEVLLEWFNTNIKDIFDICFSKGSVKDSSKWANVVWYINKVGDNVVDEMFNIEFLKQKLPANAVFGTRGGGTTIQLPFGFVQWHSPRKVIPGEIQFHHQYKTICSICKR